MHYNLPFICTIFWTLYEPLADCNLSLIVKSIVTVLILLPFQSNKDFEKNPDIDARFQTLYADNEYIYAIFNHDGWLACNLSLIVKSIVTVLILLPFQSKIWISPANQPSWLNIA